MGGAAGPFGYAPGVGQVGLAPVAPHGAFARAMPGGNGSAAASVLPAVGLVPPPQHE